MEAINIANVLLMVMTLVGFWWQRKTLADDEFDLSKSFTLLAEALSASNCNCKVGQLLRVLFLKAVSQKWAGLRPCLDLGHVAKGNLSIVQYPRSSQGPSMIKDFGGYFMCGPWTSIHRQSPSYRCQGDPPAKATFGQAANYIVSPLLSFHQAANSTCHHVMPQTNQSLRIETTNQSDNHLVFLPSDTTSLYGPYSLCLCH